MPPPAPQPDHFGARDAGVLLLRSLPAEACLAARLRGLLSTKLASGQPDLELLAARLGFSPRTLQRRLQAQGTSFLEVVDDFRREMAASLLDNRQLAIKEVAFLLGYGDLSSFYRAFRRWHGTSPQRYRLASDAKTLAPPANDPRPAGR